MDVEQARKECQDEEKKFWNKVNEAKGADVKSILLEYRKLVIELLHLKKTK